MKALIIVTVLAMATSAIAVPLSRQAKAQALLAAMQDNAKMEGWLRDIGGFLKKLDPTMLRDGLRLLNGGVVRVQTKSLDLQPEKPEGGVRSHSLGRVPDQSADSLDLSDENNNHFDVSDVSDSDSSNYFPYSDEICKTTKLELRRNNNNDDDDDDKVTVKLCIL